MNNKLPLQIAGNCKLILFDGHCKLCNFWVRFIIKNDPDKIFKLGSVQSTQGQQILQYFGMPTTHFDTMLYVDGELIYTKSAAAIQIAAQLKLPWRLLSGLAVVPATILDFMYDRIAKNRYRLFGRYEHCLLPTADHAERFLDELDD